MKYRVAGDGWEKFFDAARGPIGREWNVSDENGTAHSFRVEELDEGVYRVTHAGEAHILTILPGNRADRPLRFLVDGVYQELEVIDEIDRLEALLGGDAGAGGEESLESTMPGVIRKVMVKEGDTVELDQPLLILEAMKMENEIRSPAAGTIARISVDEGTTVATGDELLLITRS